MPKQTARKTARRTAQPSGPRKVTRAQLIDLLNKDLAKEFSALIQYVQHAAVIIGPEYDAIAAELTAHSNEEHLHALTRSNQIAFLGGAPAVDASDTHTPSDSKTMPEQDLDGEPDAIARCRERIAQAEMLQEHGPRRALEDILIVEEEHARDLQSALSM